MSRIGDYIIELEEAGAIVFDEITASYIKNEGIKDDTN